MKEFIISLLKALQSETQPILIRRKTRLLEILNIKIYGTQVIIPILEFFINLNILLFNNIIYLSSIQTPQLNRIRDNSECKKKNTWGMITILNHYS